MLFWTLVIFPSHSADEAVVSLHVSLKLTQITHLLTSRLMRGKLHLLKLGSKTKRFDIFLFSSFPLCDSSSRLLVVKAMNGFSSRQTGLTRRSKDEARRECKREERVTRQYKQSSSIDFFSSKPAASRNEFF